MGSILQPRWALVLERRAENDPGKGPGGAAEVGVEDGVEGGADTFVAALKAVLETVLPHTRLLPQLPRKAAVNCFLRG